MSLQALMALLGSPDTPEQAPALDPAPQGRLIEIFFSIIQKKVISPNNFANLAELASTLLAFVQRYSKTAKPFSWEFTSADLTRMLRRIEVETPAPASTLLAA